MDHWILETRALCKTHGCGDASILALCNVDLQVAAGEFVAIMGDSGSGKSTLLHLLAGLDVPDTGRVILEGVDIDSLSDAERTLLRRRRVGLVFQAFQLLDILTAEENVALPLAISGCSPTRSRRRALQALEAVGLYRRRAHRPNELSGGEQQRVAIARALAVEPALLLADEPTGNLDSAQGGRIIALLRQLADEHRQTILMVTHNREHAALADRVLVMRDGKLNEQAAAPAPEEYRAVVDAFPS